MTWWIWTLAGTYAIYSLGCLGVVIVLKTSKPRDKPRALIEWIAPIILWPLWFSLLMVIIGSGSLKDKGGRREGGDLRVR